jgi:hypothetical protein
MCYIDGQESKYSVLNECNRLLKYNNIYNISFDKPWLILLQFLITYTLFSRNFYFLSNSFASTINIHLRVQSSRFSESSQPANKSKSRSDTAASSLVLT